MLPLALALVLNLCYRVVLSCSCDTASLDELGIENGHIPDQAMKASSSLDNNHGPGRARLNQGPTGSQGTAWCAKSSDKDQFLQIDLIFTSRVTHVATQGMSDPPTVPGGSGITSWVKKYSLEYSLNGNTYNGYYFNQGLKVFDANDDGASVSCCELPYPMEVRYLRFRPISWHESICLRVGVFGQGNVTAQDSITKEEIAVWHYWWWPFLWILLAFFLSMCMLTICIYRRMKGRLALRPKVSKSFERTRPSSFINPMSQESKPQNGQVNIAMETMGEEFGTGEYEEPEDEVQEVVAHFTEDGFSYQHGITHFSVADEEEDESPAAQVESHRFGSTREFRKSIQNYSLSHEMYSTPEVYNDSLRRSDRAGSNYILETLG